MIDLKKRNPYWAVERARKGGIGGRIYYFEELGSTQDKAAELAAAGEAHGAVVIAEQQTQGRGRMGRGWFSPGGRNIYATVILRPRMKPDEVPALSLACGLAAAEAMGRFVAPEAVAVKWPNDVWIRGKKAAGILAQAVAAPRGVGDEGASGPDCVLVGIGINVNLEFEEIPEELRGRATSIRIEAGGPVERAAVAQALFERMEARVGEVAAGGFAAIRQEYCRRLALVGRRVNVEERGGLTITGEVREVDADGALVVETGEGMRRILSGDVTSVGGVY